MIALANGKDRLPDRVEPSIKLVIPNTNGQCRTIPGNHTGEPYEQVFGSPVKNLVGHEIH